MRLRLRAALRGRRRLLGVIAEADEEHVTVMVDQEKFVVPYRAIAQARLQDAGEGVDK